MKKQSVLNLIRYHGEHNDFAFRSEAAEIAREFDRTGDYKLAEYIMALIAEKGSYAPQSASEHSDFLDKLPPSSKSLPLPEAIADDVRGMINAIGHDAGINKFLFHGPAGTGKTETAKHVARILDRDLYSVNLASIVDSKLGQTSKNISNLFDELNHFPNPAKIIVLFDEIDAIALDRTDNHDIREMGRATTTFLGRLDNLNDQIVLIATTNLFDKFDKALSRRFDATIDFGRYTQEDLAEISLIVLNSLLDRFPFAGKDARLFKKIVALAEKLPYPAEFSNEIKTAIAFSDPSHPLDYLRRLYKDLIKSPIPSLKELREQGFTIREIETLTGVSASTISKELKA